MESPQKPNKVRAGPFTNEDLRLWEEDPTSEADLGLRRKSAD